jgi:hypothetical protein
MTPHPIKDLERYDVLSRRMRFVLVNERIPRANACCALCCASIERGYVRDQHTRLLYCDAQCFAEHEKTAMPATVRNARKVS